MENWTEAGRHCFPREAGGLEDDVDDVLPRDWGQWFPWTCSLIHGPGCHLWEIPLRPIDGQLEGCLL